MSKPYLNSKTLCILALSPLALALNQALAQDLSITKTLEHNESTPASFCTILSSELENDNELLKYVTLYHQGKKVPVSLQVSQRQLCISPLEHGKSYDLVLKHGLSAKDGSVLNEDFKTSFTISDAPSFLALERGQIITSQRDDQILVNARNVQNAKLYLYKINLNHLTALNLRDYLQNIQEPYNLSPMIREHGFFIKEIPLNFKGEKNSQESLKVSLKDQKEPLEPGLYYLILAADSLEFNPRELESLVSIYQNSKTGLLSSKLLIKSDLALTTYKSNAGLNLSLRSFSNAKPISNATLSLISRSAEVLSETKTNKEGFASFNQELLQGKLGNSPAYIIAKSKDDLFAFDLNSDPLLLEGVKESSTNSSLKPLVFLDRDLLRPDETLHLSVYMRDLKGDSVLNNQYQLKILSPNGTVMGSYTLKDSGNGRYAYDYTLPKNATFGQWRFELYDLNDKLLESQNFEVRSYVPSRILAYITQNQDKSFTLEAQYAYGSPATLLNTQTNLKTYLDESPFEEFKDYHFGPYSDKAQEYTREEVIATSPTDVDGQVLLNLDLKADLYPKIGLLSSQIFDENSQSTFANHLFKIPGSAPLVGVKREAKDGLVFNPILVNPQGELESGTVSWTLEKVITDYQYILKDGVWDYRQISIKRPAASGEVEIDKDDPKHSLISFNGEDGTYLLTLNYNGVETSYLDSLGFSVSSKLNAPDRLNLNLNAQTLKVDEDFTISFDSPFEGYGTLALGRNDIVSLKNFEVKKGYNRLEIPYDEKLFPRSSALITIYDENGAKSPGAKRLLGVCPLSFELKNKDLNISALLANSYESNQEIEIPIKISGQNKADKLTVEGFLVDEGILTLSNYKQPNALDTLYDPKELGIKIYDSFGRLTSPLSAKGQGYGATYDEMGVAARAQSLQSLASLSTNAYSLRLDPITLENGEGVFKVKLPKFNGQMRLDLIAASENAIDNHSYDLQIKAPVVISPNLPTFLRKDDLLESSINLTATQDALKEGFLQVSCEGALKCALEQNVALEYNQKLSVPLKIEAQDSGLGKISLNFESETFKDHDEINLAVMPRQAQVVKTHINYLKPGQKESVDVTQGLSEVIALSSSLNTIPGFNLETIKKLSATPYVYTLMDKAALLRLSLLQNEDPKVIQENIDNVSLLSLSQGNFSTSWQDYNRTESLYAIDSLLLAYERGFDVSLDLIKATLSSLKQNSPYGSAFERTYSNLILLKAKENIDVQGLKYLFDEEEIKNVQAYAALSQIFYLTGDKDRALEALKRGMAAFAEHQDLKAQLERAQNDHQRRDLEQLLGAFEEGALNDLSLELTSLMQSATLIEDETSLSELALKLAAFNSNYLSLPKAQSLLELSLGQNEVNKLITYPAKLGAVEVVNDEKQNLFASTQALGYLVNEEAIANEKLNFTKEYFTFEGQKLAIPTNLKVGDKIVVKLNLDHTLPQREKILITDYLPAGFSLEGALKASDLANFPDAHPNVIEPQVSDDRQLITLVWNDHLSYYYVLRATQEGVFAMPSSSAQSSIDSKVLSTSESKAQAFKITK